jgi:hypothetical protein
MLTFRELQVGEEIEISKPGNSKATHYCVSGALPIDTLGHKGLDGAILRQYKCMPLHKAENFRWP